MHFVYNGLRLCRKKENGMAERKIDFKPGNMLYPLPVVLVGCADREWAAASGNGGQAAGRQGGRNGQDTHGNSVQRRSEVQHANLFTVAWTGTVCTNPPMLSISVRPERYSYHMIEETGVFTVNLTNEALAKAVDFCGVKSGRDTDKWRECHLTPARGSEVAAPYILEAPVSIECRVAEKRPLGSHTLFLADVVAVHCDSAYLDEDGSFHLEEARPIVYSHGTYFVLGKKLGSFGYSVKKPAKGKRKKK